MLLPAPLGPTRAMVVPAPRAERDVLRAPGRPGGVLEAHPVELDLARDLGHGLAGARRPRVLRSPGPQLPDAVEAGEGLAQLGGAVGDAHDRRDQQADEEDVHHEAAEGHRRRRGSRGRRGTRARRNGTEDHERRRPDRGAGVDLAGHAAPAARSSRRREALRLVLPRPGTPSPPGSRRASRPGCPTTCELSSARWRNSGRMRWNAKASAAESRRAAAASSAVSRQFSHRSTPSANTAVSRLPASWMSPLPSRLRSPSGSFMIREIRTPAPGGVEERDRAAAGTLRCSSRRTSMIARCGGDPEHAGQQQRGRWPAPAVAATMASASGPSRRTRRSADHLVDQELARGGQGQGRQRGSRAAAGSRAAGASAGAEQLASLVPGLARRPARGCPWAEHGFAYLNRFDRGRGGRASLHRQLPHSVGGA